MASHVGRRKFLATLGGAAVAWPLAARAQQAGRMRRVGMMVPYPKGDAEYELRIRTLRQELAKLGWTEGSNIQFDERWTTDDMSRVWADAASLVSLAPDVVVAFATQSITALQQVTRSIPIVFANVIDPVGAGFVTTLARPGGNTTGFTAFEYSLSGKWLELLKEIAPNVTRVAVLRDPTLAAAIGQYAVIQAVASSSLELSVIDIRDASEIERALASFAHEPNGGLIITASSKAVVFREQISSLATRYRLPNVYYARYYPAIGGLVSYGPDPFDSYRRAAGYVDRILKGEKPADLPVQTPTRYELVINLKTAKAIGLQIPPTLLARADEVIE